MIKKLLRFVFGTKEKLNESFIYIPLALGDIIKKSIFPYFN